MVWLWYAWIARRERWRLRRERRALRRAVRRLEDERKQSEGRLDDAMSDCARLEGKIEVMEDQLRMFHAWRQQETAWREQEAAIYAARKAAALSYGDIGAENRADVIERTI